MNSPQLIASRPTSGRWLLVFGVLLPVVGIGVYAAQVSMHRLSMPWYLPAAAALGVILVAGALWRRRTVWRIVALVVVTLLAGMEGTFLYATRLPAYAGPAQAGRAFPDFKTVRADGTSFTERDLVGDRDSILVFFRGRW